MKKQLAMLSIILLCVLLMPIKSKALPFITTYQGFLTNKAGSALDNESVKLEFGMYHQQTGGTSIWSETHESVYISRGVFTVTLGETTPFDASLLTDNLYLEIKINGEVRPRERITGGLISLRSEHAAVADTVKDNAITTNKIANGSITQDKFAGNVIQDSIQNAFANHTITAQNLVIGYATECNSNREGALRYNQSLKIMEFCNGSEWQSMATGNSEPQPQTPGEQFTNSLGMTFVRIPAGSFTMGSPPDEPERGSGEVQHKVTLTKSYYMQTTEVTNGQFVSFLNDINKRGPDGEPWFRTKSESSSSHIQGDTGNYHVESGYEDHPVIYVSWYGATAMAEWLSTKEAKNYRLPTEAEWEYAARAGTTTPFAFGNCLSTDHENYHGNYPLSGCSKGEYRGTTVITGSLSANPWGLYDVHGNVWEWVCDWYSAYSTTDVSDPTGPATGSNRVVRGGSWYDFARYCRSADRDRGDPDDAYNILGFRLCAPGR
jgi:formylglycine-generating enzyme required for sulfatase activity